MSSEATGHFQQQCYICANKQRSLDSWRIRVVWACNLRGKADAQDFSQEPKKKKQIWKLENRANSRSKFIPRITFHVDAKEDPTAEMHLQTISVRKLWLVKHSTYSTNFSMIRTFKHRPLGAGSEERTRGGPNGFRLCCLLSFLLCGSWIL